MPPGSSSACPSPSSRRWWYERGKGYAGLWLTSYPYVQEVWNRNSLETLMDHIQYSCKLLRANQYYQNKNFIERHSFNLSLNVPILLFALGIGRCYKWCWGCWGGWFGWCGGFEWGWLVIIGRWFWRPSHCQSRQPLPWWWRDSCLGRSEPWPIACSWSGSVWWIWTWWRQWGCRCGRCDNWCPLWCCAAIRQILPWKRGVWQLGWWVSGFGSWCAQSSGRFQGQHGSWV